MACVSSCVYYLVAPHNLPGNISCNERTAYCIECGPECTTGQRALRYNFAVGIIDCIATICPPSTVMVAPFTYDPARLAKKTAAPVTSSGVPMRCIGLVVLMMSPCVRRVCAITEMVPVSSWQRSGRQWTYSCSRRALTEHVVRWGTCRR